MTNLKPCEECDTKTYCYICGRQLCSRELHELSDEYNSVRYIEGHFDKDGIITCVSCWSKQHPDNVRRGFPKVSSALR